MKKSTLLLFIGVAMVFAFVWGIKEAKSPNAIVARQVAERAQLERANKYNVEAGNSLGEQMEYFMDSRPNPPQCFGYLWRGEAGSGGPALASVTCESVKDLIKNGVSQKSF